MEQETLRVPAARIGRGPQGKAAVDSMVAGDSGRPPEKISRLRLSRMRMLRAAKPLAIECRE